MKAAIFDMDGTILDSMDMWNRSLPAFLEKLNIEFDDKFIEGTRSMSLDQMCTFVANNYDVPFTEDEIRTDWKNMILQAYKDEVQVKDGAEEFLRSLKGKGMKLSIATLTEHFLCDEVLEYKGLSKYFDFVLTTEDVNMVSKHRPDLFLKCASLMDAEPSQCVVFEDSLYPVKSAKEAGFKVCIIEDKGMISKKKELIESSDRYIASFRELL